MKNYYLIILVFGLAILGSCSSEDANEPDTKTIKVVTACGVKDVAHELPWLKAIISRAEDDRINKTYNGRYSSGTIYLQKHEGKDVFYYLEAVSSCTLCSVYYCDGTKVDFTNSNSTAFFNNLKKDKIIYTSLPK